MTAFGGNVLPLTFVTTFPQFGDKILRLFRQMFRDYISRILVRRPSNVRYDIASGAQRLPSESLGTAPQDRSDNPPQAAQKTADTLASLKYDRGREDGSDTGNPATRLMKIVPH